MGLYLKSVLFIAVAASCLANARADETPAAELVRVLEASRSPLGVAPAGLTGAGAEALVRNARTAEFILIGEDHGFADVPQFVLALKTSLGADAPPNLALEIGPLAAERLSEAARKHRLPALALAYPYAIPFFSWIDDGAMADAWQAGSPEPRLWGLDQEFILSARMNLERLQAIEVQPPARSAIQALLERAREAEATMAAQHNPTAALLPALTDADFDRLRAALHPSAGSAADSILQELQESAAIYRGQDQDAQASNHQRSLMMKRHFMHAYQGAKKGTDTFPRALFRLGAYHAGRGLSPIHQYDIGNLASELAASHGATSLHVLVIAAGGTVNQWFPFMADTAASAAPYDAQKELQSLEATPFIEHALSDPWTTFDLAPLRKARAARKAGGSLFEQLVFAYDYVVVIPKAHAAVAYPSKN